MKTFYDVLKAKSKTPEPLTGGRFVGLEVEIEHVMNIPQLPDGDNKEYPMNGSNWLYKRDGSLRNNGMEFVTIPVPNYTVQADLDLFKRWLNLYKWAPSARCGIHVHVDCRDFEPIQIDDLITTYCLCEPLMFDFVGKEREEGIFCVPWYRASDDLDNYLANVQRHAKSPRDFLSQLHMYMCKYSALYLEPLYRFGTVEFRHAPTWTDMGKFAQWIAMCVDVVNFAYRNKAKKIVTLYESNPTEFVEQVFVSSHPSFSRPAVELIEANDSDFLARKIVGFEPSSKGWNQEVSKTRSLPPKPVSAKTTKTGESAVGIKKAKKATIKWVPNMDFNYYD